MPVAQYLCDNCQSVLEKLASEQYPANMTYAPPNTRSHLFKCSSDDCTSRFVAVEDGAGKMDWETKEEDVFNNIFNGIKERQERGELKEEKERLQSEKAELEKMIDDNPKKIEVIKREMENIKTQVNKMTDEYEERSNQCGDLEEAVRKGKSRLDDIEKRLHDLMHIKLD
jgi:hypothetical protein